LYFFQWGWHNYFILNFKYLKTIFLSLKYQILTVSSIVTSHNSASHINTESQVKYQTKDFKGPFDYIRSIRFWDKQWLGRNLENHCTRNTERTPRGKVKMIQGRNSGILREGGGEYFMVWNYMLHTVLPIKDATSETTLRPPTGFKNLFLHVQIFRLSQ